MARKTSTYTAAEADFTFADLVKALWRFLGEKRFAFLGWVSVMVAVSSIGLLPAYLVGRLIDFFTAYKPGDPLTTLYLLAAGYGGIYAINALVRLHAKQQLAGIEIDTIYNARVEGFERLMDFSLTWHSGENTGNKIQRIQNGIDNIRAIIRSLGGNFFKVFIQLAGIFFIMLSQGSAILLFICIYTAIIIFLERSFYGRLREAQIRGNKHFEDSSGTYFESTNNLLTIKTLGLKKGVSAKVAEKEMAAKESRLEIRSLGIRKWQFFQALNGLAIAAFILLIGHRFVEGLITVGLIFTLYSYFMRFIDMISDAADIFVDFIEYSAGISRMMPIYETAVISGNEPFPTDWKEIRAEEVEFSYQTDSRESHITGLNLVVPRGKKIGIAGKTGSGKSTIIKLILGLYPLKSGSLTIGNTEISSIRHEELTHHLATVLQETELFNLSLKDNLTLFKNVSANQLEKAVRISQLQPVIDKLPHGIDSIIGEKGYRLSGGERQRLGIARAICADTEIMIFDEATSALDSKTEAAIQQALVEELQEVTMIVIAHRLSTLKDLDYVYVFQNGRVIEEGNFDELTARKGGSFAEMYRLQGHA